MIHSNLTEKNNMTETQINTTIIHIFEIHKSNYVFQIYINSLFNTYKLNK